MMFFPDGRISLNGGMREMPVGRWSGVRGLRADNYTRMVTHLILAPQCVMDALSTPSFPSTGEFHGATGEVCDSSGGGCGAGGGVCGSGGGACDASVGLCGSTGEVCGRSVELPHRTVGARTRLVPYGDRRWQVRKRVFPVAERPT